MYSTATPAVRGDLTTSQKEVVRATLPVVGENIGTIAENFYHRMFAAHPDYIANLFNRGNQKSGAQQKALAASVATFATQLVDPNGGVDEATALLSRIAHKHVSLGITWDQYQVVHDHLFAAIVDVLGGAVTTEVAAAWDEVYWLMARTLANHEQRLYDSAGVAANEVFREADVVSKEMLSPDVALLRIASKGFTDTRPGQYVTIGVELSDGAQQKRQYSLVDWDSDGFSIAIQREGEVSNRLIDDTPSTVLTSLPAGDLVLAEDSLPVVLVSSGIGSTPMAGMLNALAAVQGERKVFVIHVDNSPEDFAQREVLTTLSATVGAPLRVYYRSQNERLDIDCLTAEDSVPNGAHWYLCGGDGFLHNVRAQIDEFESILQPASVNVELFSPNDWLF